MPGIGNRLTNLEKAKQQEDDMPDAKETKPQTEMSNEEWNAYLAATFGKLGIPVEPTCGMAYGIRIDYCYGVRIKIPATLAPRRFRIILYDAQTHLKVFDSVLVAGDYFVSRRRYFIPYGIQITDADTGEKICQHHYNAKGMPVVIDMPVPTIGDSIAWFSYCEAFQKKHQCELYVCLPEIVRPLFEKEYPDIHFISRADKSKLYPYAHYTIGVYTEGNDDAACPVDYRLCALHHYAAYMLGLKPDRDDTPPRVSIPAERTIKEPYVCISSLASGMCKEWIHPNGWATVVAFLKKAGYRVIDIDKSITQGDGIHWVSIPREAEDFTGDLPLTQRAELIAHADFYIGLGSGLSWLAWCCKVPVVMISGFSLPTSEFYTPYRVINMNVCHGCYSDTRYKFINHEHDWCPKHKGTPQHYECTRGITPEMVIDTIKTIPEFQRHADSIKTQGEKK